MQKPLFLILDGMSQIFRAYYAIRGLSNSQGLPTNAVYGFGNMLRRVLDKYPPDYVCVAFDRPEPTTRHLRYAAYKAKRKKMPADLSQQIPYIKRFCEAMGIGTIEAPTVEADDLIGTVARKAEQAGLYPMIVTLDKDLLQLVDITHVLNTSRDDLIIDRDKVKELYGVYPEQIPDLLGLWGDSSDNIPGAPGIGEKGARDLIERFGSVEACLERAAEVENAKHRRSIVDHAEQIILSKQLVTIDTNLPINVNLSDFERKPPDRALLVPLLRELEFTAILRELLASEPLPELQVLRGDQVPRVDDRLILELGPDRILLWTGTGPVHDLPLDGRVGGILSDSRIRKTVHNVKDAIVRLRRHGIELSPPYDDLMLMGYLLFPNRGKYELDDLVIELFGTTVGGDRHWWIGRLYEELAPRVRQELARVYEEIELPLSPVLADLEETGVRVDVGVLETMSEEMAEALDGLTGRIHGLAGCEFNINSPRQLGEVLFDRLELPRSRKLRKSGQYSTAVEVLEELAEHYELPRLVLEYRQLAKFKSTYVDVIPQMVDPATHRLHTSLNQTVAATGRLSSSSPNLQNIPVRRDLGRKIRSAFVPEPGWWLVSGDYSQVELRIVAHLSGDERLAESFSREEDVHARTAAEVLGLRIDQVTDEQRERAKAVNYGLVYGQTPFGLAQQVGISPSEAQEFIERYFDRYRGVRHYIEECLKQARETGVVRTLFGRLRQIPEINSRNGMRRSMAERAAINSPIQGTAADIIKLAMIRISKELGRQGLGTRMVLQVHDELLFEVPEEELWVVDTVRDLMQDVVRLRVPLTVNMGRGRNWEELG